MKVPRHLIPDEYLPVLTMKELAIRWKKGRKGYKTIQFYKQKAPHLLPPYITVGKFVFFPIAWIEEFEKNAVKIHNPPNQPI